MEYAALILVHIVSAFVWGGGVLIAGFFFVPAILEAGPGGGAVMGGVMKRKYSEVLLATGFLAILSGLRLYFIRAAAPGWGGSPEGMVLGLGGLLAISALAIGLFRQRPLAMKMGKLAAEGRGAEIPAVAAQLKKYAVIAAWHVVAVIILMAGHQLAAQIVVPAAEAPAASAPAVAPH